MAVPTPLNIQASFQDETMQNPIAQGGTINAGINYGGLFGESKTNWLMIGGAVLALIILTKKKRRK